MPLRTLRSWLVGYQGGFLAGRLLVFILDAPELEEFRLGLTDGVLSARTGTDAA